jgi:hypothetical protein
MFAIWINRLSRQASDCSVPGHMPNRVLLIAIVMAGGSFVGVLIGTSLLPPVNKHVLKRNTGINSLACHSSFGPEAESSEIKMRRANMAAKFTSQEISEKYNRFARWYDWVEGIPDVLGLSRLRRRLLKRALGKSVGSCRGNGKELEVLSL